MNLKSFIPPFIISIGFFSVVLIIWNEEFKHYQKVANSSDLPINSKLDFDFLSAAKPSYLHFFAEDCRNARINIEHIKNIFSTFENDANFFLVNSGSLDSELLRKKYHVPMNVTIIDDHERLLTHSLKVQSLPYALIATADHILFFGGNYNNENGLCGPGDILWSSPAVALKFLLKHQTPPLFPSYQRNFVGCAID